MSMDSWTENNNRYLAASLEWLRLRLRSLALAEPASQAAVAPVPAQVETQPCEGRGWKRWLGDSRSSNPGVKLLHEGKPPALEEQLKEAAADRAAAAGSDPPPALIILAHRLGLSDFERDTLLLCAATEFDPGLASLCALAQGVPARNYPTFGLALSAFDEPSWDALSAHRPLRYARLIEICQPGPTPLTSSALRADERAVNFIKGLNTLDDRLSAFLSLVGPEDGAALAESQQAVVDVILRRLLHSDEETDLLVVQLLGVDVGSKLAVARQICAFLERRLYRVAAEALPSQAAEIETLTRLWQRESFLLPVALYIDGENLDGVQEEQRASFYRFLSREVGVIFLGVREAPLKLSVANFSVDVERPAAAEQCNAWRDLLSAIEPEAATEPMALMLAGQFNLNLGDIRETASLARRSSDEDTSFPDRLWNACRDLTRPRLDLLAQRLDVKATWNDLVLPDEQMKLMRNIAGQVRERHKVYDQWGFASKMNRGFGISALFAGESGTGKTMAAEVIANELRMNLYRIDLSAVVSKYIGETEKNLRKLFDAAERGGAILLFDEADALFGKRSEVKDSHDRYANIEINYLLQRMECFSGLAILATNMKTALDPAFMRRLRFIVNFEFPGIKERTLIWQKALPPETPTAALDYERLARLNLTGGNIHSIALNAAFLAAQDGGFVTMRILLAAARMELRKLDKPFNEAELR